MSWSQLISIALEAADSVRDEKSRPPKACPNDGEPLISGPNGSLHCRFDGYLWPRDGR